MATGSGMRLERWLLAVLGVLAFAGGCWMWAAAPWPAQLAVDGGWPAGTWTAFIRRFHLSHLAGTLPALFAIDVMLAASLGFALSLLATPPREVRMLRRALVGGALAMLYLLQLRLVVAQAAVVAIAGSALAAAVLVSAATDLAVFMIGYPRKWRQEDRGAIFGHQPSRFHVLPGLRHRLDDWFQRILRLPGGGHYGSEVLARRWASDGMRLMRAIEHPAFRLGLVAATVGCVVLPLPRDLSTLATLLVSSTAFMAIATSFGLLAEKYQVGDAAERRRIGWIYMGPLAGFLLMVAWVLVLPMLGMLVPGALDAGGPRVFGMGLAQVWFVGIQFMLPVLVASFLLGLAVSMFYRGAIDPRLAIRRSLVAGICGILLTALFVGVENLVSAEVATRFGMPDATGSLVAGTIAALTFSPLRTRLERMVGSWLSRRMPEDGAAGDGASPAQPDGTTTYSTTSRP